jgi:hypothetical protein
MGQAQPIADNLPHAKIDLMGTWVPNRFDGSEQIRAFLGWNKQDWRRFKQHLLDDGAMFYRSIHITTSYNFNTTILYSYDVLLLRWLIDHSVRGWICVEPHKGKISKT